MKSLDLYDRIMENYVFYCWGFGFKIGETITLDGKFYCVKRFGLFVSQFYTPHNDIVFIQNSIIYTNMRVGYDREVFSKIITLNLHPNTPRKKLDKLEIAIRRYVIREPEYFDDDYVIAIKIEDCTGAALVISIKVLYRYDAEQTEEIQHKIHSKFQITIRDLLDECDIVLASGKDILNL